MGNVDVFIIPETKIDESFPVGNFLIDSFSSRYRVDRVSAVGNILLYVREDISSSLLAGDTKSIMLLCRVKST